jgi:hypothetical protein
MVFETDVVGAEFDPWRQIPGGDDDVCPLMGGVGSECRDGGQDDETASGDASGHGGA